MTFFTELNCYSYQVGISVEFPGGTTCETNLNHKAFFEFLLNKGEAYEKIPAERFNVESWKGRNLGQVLTDTGSFLKNLDSFDHVEFGITATDAKSMSLSTRKLIEHSFLALLDSGIDYRRRNVGSYMSGVNFDLTTIADPDEYEARGSFAGYPYMIANKVSYHLDLVGPSIPIDTACSSGLTATHLAVQALRAGDCEAAVVGGSQLNHRLIDFVQYSQGSVLSPDGKCKPFDVSANGFGRGEGVCVVVLKPLDAALRDGDRLYASILGTGVNSCGGAAPVSAPVGDAQAEAMERAYKYTGRSPSKVDFIELHATGSTAVGDPTEANWIGRKFQRDDELLIGSVKGNIGHLEITAFLASLSKVCSILKTGLIPPNVNLQNLNPAIRWDEYKLRVPTEVTQLRARDPSGRALISMTSSGIGGVNGHAVLEGPPISSPAVRVQAVKPILFVVGGLSPRSASSIAVDVAELVLKENADVFSVASIYGRRSRQMTWRTSAIWVPSKNKLEFPQSTFTSRAKHPLVFVFSGQGPQHINMGRQLYTTYPIFCESIKRMDNFYKKTTGQSLIELTGLFDVQNGGNIPNDIWPIAITLPALAMVQMALFDLLVSIGVSPDIVVGHSAGETAMLYASGSAPQEMALEIAIARGVAMTMLEEVGGAMAAINCTVGQAEEIISSVLGSCQNAVLEIACYNAPQALTLSGNDEPINQVIGLAKSRGIFAQKLRTRIPVHSSCMEICRQTYQSSIKAIFQKYTVTKPTITAYSCVTGLRWTEPFTADYFWDNALNPVLFSSAISSLFGDTPHAAFIEISPHPVLSQYIDELSAKRSSSFCPMRRTKNPDETHEIYTFLDCIGKLSVSGYNVYNYLAVNQAESVDFDLDLPPYRFSPKTIPYLPQSSRVVTRQREARNGPLNFGDLKLSSLTQPDIAEHVIRGEAIMPAAGFIEMAFEFGARFVWKVEFKGMLSLPQDKVLPIDVSVKGKRWNVHSLVEQRNAGAKVNILKRLHATGFLSTVLPSDKLADINLKEIEARCNAVNVDGFYDNLHYFAQYGPRFRRVESCHIGQGEALVQVRAATPDLPNLKNYVIHPAIFDACFHIMVYPLFTGNADRTGYYLPSCVDSIILHQPTFFSEQEPPLVYTYVKIKDWAPETMSFDLIICDANGVRICTLLGFEVARHQIDHMVNVPRKRFDLVYEPVQPLSIYSSPSLNGHFPNEKANQSSINAQNENGIDVKVNPRRRSILQSILNGKSPQEIHSLESNRMQTVLSFKLDEVLSLQQKMSSLKQTKQRIIWIEASQDSDGFAAQGFFRAWRRETFSFEIRLVLFDCKWKQAERCFIIETLARLPNLEPELLVDSEGMLRVPRLVPLESPSSQDGGQSVHSELPVLMNGEVLIRITSMTPPAGKFRGFIGHIEESGSKNWSKNSLVAGVANLDLANYAAVSTGQIVPVQEDFSEQPNEYASIVIAAFIVSSVLGLAPIDEVDYFADRRVLVTDSETGLQRIILRILQSLRMSVTSTTSSLSINSIAAISEAEIIISGFTQEEDCELIRDAMASNAVAFFWNDPKSTFFNTANPSIVSYHLQSILPRISSCFRVVNAISKPPRDYLSSNAVAIRKTLFLSSKVYLLIGGIGALGLHVALWMYQKGAKEIILTSRSGRQSLIKSKNAMGMHILNYLEKRPDLNIRLEACDASSQHQTTSLIQSLSKPLGGCILLSVVLSDRLFLSHTRESFYTPVTSKAGAFKVLERSVDINSLDFLVSLSSAAIFGNIGQTNYASANTQLDGLLGSYKNAFSLVAPAILDSTTISRTEDFMPDARYSSWIPWALTSTQLCYCLEDGIRKLNETPFSLYIPDFKWEHVQEQFGSNPLYDHLVPIRIATEDRTTEVSESSLEQTVLSALDIDHSDFSLDVPLTVYGLDSLSAGRLALALRPFVAITQLQLLGDISFNDIKKRTNNVGLKAGSTKEEQKNKNTFDWKALNRPGETVVKLIEGEGTPLILIHGAGGFIVPFFPLQERFKTPLWAIQRTPETPTDTVEEIAEFYFMRIKKACPSGPYRLGGYSASSLLALEIVTLLEVNGDHVSQLVFLDHFPLLFSSPSWSLDAETIESGYPSRGMIWKVFSSVADMYRRESSLERQGIADEMADAFLGRPARPYIKQYCLTMEKYMAAVIKYILRISATMGQTTYNLDIIREYLIERMAKLAAPITVVHCAKGLMLESEWEDYGVKAYLPTAKLALVPYGHFDMFEKEDVVELLESGIVRQV
ncbi:hypothetical protein M422DRAFT_171681 [Sphaerobolus stellatus SS14]|uniref:Polyketide synthase n=1 Tax=Sphaerobolus stellatus (strain SS14) TaxID=990650 RepID=A0A0C9VTU9_SPHS4|nr:hypothetical protein M422DRAFT_171681 [Sphaerobolus stellatus SS14]